MPTVRWVVRVLIVALMGSVLMLSCQSTSPEHQMSLGGPMVKDAQYIGMESCEVCHPEQAKRFELTSHFGTSVKEGEQVKGEACESCHGPGSLHMDAGGDPSKIVRYSPERCFVCHVDIRAKFQLQYHHPVPEKWLKCTNCHDPHGQDVKAWSAVSVLRPGELCFECHKQFKGPFVFQHDPVRFGCQVCHDPHGAVFNKMLIADARTLCLRCHWEPAVNTPAAQIGRAAHAGFPIGRGVDCIDHHTAVHGSNTDRHFFR